MWDVALAELGETAQEQWLYKEREKRVMSMSDEKLERGDGQVQEKR